MPSPDQGTKENPILARRPARGLDFRRALPTPPRRRSRRARTSASSATKTPTCVAPPAPPAPDAPAAPRAPAPRHSRASQVGQLVWFALGKGPIHYVPDIDLYFKLHPVG